MLVSRISYLVKRILFRVSQLALVTEADLCRPDLALPEA